MIEGGEIQKSRTAAAVRRGGGGAGGIDQPDNVLEGDSGFALFERLNSPV